MQPSIPRILIVLLAIVALAVSAASVPFGGQGDLTGDTEPPTPAESTETPELPDREPAPLALLAGAVRYVFGGTLAAVAVVAVVVLFRSLSGSTPPEADPGIEPGGDTAEPVPADLGPIADAAGRAADRIQRGEALDNEVYRAWRTMTDHLDVPNRRVRTAGEFETAAVRAGMAPDDVRELTTLFEAARYGTLEPDEAEERRAVELLERIESRHGGDHE